VRRSATLGELSGGRGRILVACPSFYQRKRHGIAGRFSRREWAGAVFRSTTCGTRVSGRHALQSLLHAARRLGLPMTRADSRRGFRVTSRDREIVRWVGRLRMVTAAQVAERFGLGRAVVYARLGGLAQLGFLEHRRIFHATPGVYQASRAGLARSASSSLPRVSTCAPMTMTWRSAL
jgi:hypothetical protein